MNLWQRLGLDWTAHRCVTLVGAGGKTTLLYALAREAAQAGQRVIVTASARMLPHPRLILTGRPDDVLTHGIIQLGRALPDGKLTWSGPFAAAKRHAVVLNEGDGSAGRPLKLPAAHEPVIPVESDAVVGVAGLSAVGRPVREACHRPELVAALLGKGLDDLIAVDDLHTVLAQRKGVLPHMTYVAVFNQGDRHAADGLVTCFREEERGGLCWF